MNIKDLKNKIAIAYRYVALFNEYLIEKKMKKDFELFCEKKIGKDKIENDKENLI